MSETATTWQTRFIISVWVYVSLCERAFVCRLNMFMRLRGRDIHLMCVRVCVCVCESLFIHGLTYVIRLEGVFSFLLIYTRACLIKYLYSQWWSILLSEAKPRRIFFGFGSCYLFIICLLLLFSQERHDGKQTKHKVSHLSPTTLPLFLSLLLFFVFR